MADWNMSDMTKAVHEEVAAPASPSAPRENGATAANPQEHGWGAPVPIDYGRYNNTEGPARHENDAAFDAATAQRRRQDEQYEFTAQVYEWKDEYGDVGPRMPELEAHLFPQNGETQGVAGIRNWAGFTHLAVTQEGSVQMRPAKNFEDAGLHPVMLDNVKLCCYVSPTPVQQYTLPAVLNNYDVIACAQTGSGKTVAFLLPILSKFMGKAKKWAAPRPNPAEYDRAIHGQIRAEPLALIIVPTRELAVQIFNEARKLCYRTMLRPAVIYGGTPIGAQIEQLTKGADILIATPGRLVDFLNRPDVLSLRRIRYIVIDEADEMLKDDWQTEFKAILTGGDIEPGNVTYLMFSATFPKNVRDLARTYLKEDHVRIRVGRIGSSHVNIKQDVVYVEAFAKKEALFDLLMSKPPARTIIFVNSKRTADEIDDFLFNKGIPCTSIHGDRTQREREDSLRAFRAGSCPVLIATGLSSRGIDVELVMHVINYDLPSHTHGGIEEYVHRIGRTGRSGLVGYATSFYSSREEDLAPLLVKTLCETHQPIPDFLEEHIPEGFTADGQGDVTTLKFEDDSDAGDEGGDEGGAGNAGDAGGAWGASTNDAAPAADTAKSSGFATSGFDAPAAAPSGAAATTDVWGSGGW